MSLRGMRFGIALFLSAICSSASATGSNDGATYPQADRYAMMLANSGIGHASAFIESEKRLYASLLKKGGSEVLVLPFQTQLYAVDRAERQLMSRYLADAVRDGSDEAVADVSLVARALGEHARTYKRDEIHALANAMGVRMIVWSYVGHNKDGRLVLTIAAQQRPNRDAPWPADAVSRTWSDIAFGDDRLPSEIVVEHLDEAVALIGAQRNAARPTDAGGTVDELNIRSIWPTLADGKWSAVQSAWLYQLLGVMAPSVPERARERYFEASLAALRYVPASDKHYRLLKARAYFYLHKRPRAKQLLSTPVDAGEKALSSLLDGDAIGLAAQVRSITAPLSRLIAEIELSGLNLVYKRRPDRDRVAPYLAAVPVEWRPLVERAFFERDGWWRQSNIYVKQLLDETFPLKGTTSQSLLSRAFALDGGDAAWRDVAFSVRAHLKALMDEAAAGCCVRVGIGPSRWDMLGLIEAVSDANLLREMEHQAVTQGAPQRAIAVYEAIKPAYEGHPEISWLYARALMTMSKSLQATGISRDYYRTESLRYAERAYVWAGGQTRYAHDAASYLMAERMRVYPLYNADFPRRDYWFPALPDGDLPDADTAAGKDTAVLRALAYTNTEFELLQLAERTLPAGDSRLQQAIKEVEQGRFRGHRLRVLYLAGAKKDAGHQEQAMTLLYQGIEDEPSNWLAYLMLGGLLLNEGAPAAEIRDLFWRYPVFKNYLQGRDEHPVMVANNADQAGLALLEHAAVAESLEFFAIADRTRSGAQSQLHSSQALSLARHDFAAAMMLARDSAVRYSDDRQLVQYIMLLDAFGHDETADGIMNQMKHRLSDLLIARVMLARLRARGAPASGAEVVAAAVERGLISANSSGAVRDEAYAWSNTIDRAPVYDEVARLYDGELAASSWTRYVKAYAAVLRGDYRAADQILGPCAAGDDRGLAGCTHAIWLMTWVAIQSGDTDQIKGLLRQQDSRRGSQSEYVLAKAMMAAEERRHAEAIGLLREAARRSENEWSSYNIVIALSWLYEKTREDAYRSHGLALAKKLQLAFAPIAWPYAAEALFSDEAEARMRAAGIALHLDAESALLRRLDQGVIARAHAWLKRSNPFDKDQCRDDCRPI